MNGERGTRERPSFSLLCNITDVYLKATPVSRLISGNRNVTSIHITYEQNPQKNTAPHPKPYSENFPDFLALLF